MMAYSGNTTSIKLEETACFHLFAPADGYAIKYLNTSEQEALRQKINRLGMIVFIDRHERIHTNPEYMNDLTQATVLAASILKKHRFRRYKKEEAVNALKFIEIALIYGYHENIRLNPTTAETEFISDPLIEQTMYHAQQIWHYIDHKDPHRKRSILQQITDLNDGINSVILERWQPSEQEFFHKSTQTALTIIKKHVKGINILNLAERKPFCLL
jgi:hypothetical protein